MDLLRSLASVVVGGWTSRAQRGGKGGRGSMEAPSTSPSTTIVVVVDAGHLAPQPGPPREQQQQPVSTAVPSILSPSPRSNGRSVGSNSRRASFALSSGVGGGMPPRSPLRAINNNINLPPPPSAPLPAEQVERYWRLQRRLAATLLPEVVRLEALCAEIAAAASAAEEGAAVSGSSSPSSSAPPSSPSRSFVLPSSSSAPSPRAGQDPHAATRIAALRRRTLVPLLARLRALPVTSDGAEEQGGGGREDPTMTSSSPPSSRRCSSPGSSSSSSSGSSGNNPVPTRADLAALRRAAAVLPRYVEQLRVAMRGRPQAFDSGRLCAAAAA